MSNDAARAASPGEASKQVQLTDAEAVALAVQLHQAGRLEEAGGIYRQILQAIPDQVDALHFHGLLLYQQGEKAAGIASLRRAVELRPDYAEAHNNLGNMLKETGHDEGALEAYHRVLQLRPDHADTYNNIGVLLRKRGQTEQAVEAYQRAIRLDPYHADAFHNLGNVLQGQGRLDEALAAYRQTLAYRPSREDTYVELGRIYHRAGRLEDAVRVYRDWLQRDPSNPIAQHLLAACSGQSGPARASDDYVRRTFDGFAQTFDEVLERLNYQVPDLLAGVVEEIAPDAAGAGDVLDAGCGTGLCGVRLRARARRLVGLDLSEMMLSRARERGVYDELIEAELTDFLGRHPQAYDLIVSGDTLNYFGDLTPVFAAAGTALRAGGRFLFTLEHDDDPELASGFRIHPHGRYSHAETYVRQVLSAAGLDIRLLRCCVLRKELGLPVSGMLILAQKAP